MPQTGCDHCEERAFAFGFWVTSKPQESADNQIGSTKSTANTPKVSTDIVKAPPKKEATPMQCSGNTLILENEEDVQTFLTCVSSVNMVAVVKAHTNYLMMLAHTETKALGISDGGADSVIGGPV